MNLVAIDPRSGQVLFGATFDTYGDMSAGSACAAKLESLKHGTIVLLAVKDEGSQIPERLQNAIRTCGGRGRAVEYRASWAMVGKKGDKPGSAFEAYDSSGDCVTVSRSFCEEYPPPEGYAGVYHILTTKHEAGQQPAGWGLSCIPSQGARRNHASSWVHVHSGDCD
jgi:hypothetical protein